MSIESRLAALEAKQKPEDGWSLSDFRADVSEVISDKRNLLGIMQTYQGITDLRDELASIKNSQKSESDKLSEAIVKLDQYARTFAETIEFWNQNRPIIVQASQYKPEFDKLNNQLVEYDKQVKAFLNTLAAKNTDLQTARDTLAQARTEIGTQKTTAQNEITTTKTSAISEINALAERTLQQGPEGYKTLPQTGEKLKAIADVIEPNGNQPRGGAWIPRRSTGGGFKVLIPPAVDNDVVNLGYLKQNYFNKTDITPHIDARITHKLTSPVGYFVSMNEGNLVQRVTGGQIEVPQNLNLEVPNAVTSVRSVKRLINQHYTDTFWIGEIQFNRIGQIVAVDCASNNFNNIEQELAKKTLPDWALPRFGAPFIPVALYDEPGKGIQTYGISVRVQQDGKVVLYKFNNATSKGNQWFFSGTYVGKDVS